MGCLALKNINNIAIVMVVKLLNSREEIMKIINDKDFIFVGDVLDVFLIFLDGIHFFYFQFWINNY